ncbi:MAG TPA: adenylate kinase [Candidatus Portnoybacteria bacterium]|nr:adenylate kinase [Candidatus Portnoybacteria bacterium]
METKVFTFLGRAGCGKGTQAKLLSDKLGLVYIGSGELLRERVKQGDFTGKKTDATMGQGNLVPTSLIFMLWINRLEEIKKDGGNNSKGIIFDGSPRKMVEAQMLEEALKWYEWDKSFKVVLIDLSREESFNRLTKRRQCQQCGQLIPYVGHYKNLVKCDKCNGELIVRQDDTPEAINQRLDLFDQEVTPVIKYYEDKGLLVRVNGDQPIDDVFTELLKKIND